MSLIERMREIMEKEYGIKTDADLLRAIEDAPEVDLGIFTGPAKGELIDAV